MDFRHADNPEPFTEYREATSRRVRTIRSDMSVEEIVEAVIVVAGPLRILLVADALELRVP
jgi:hypothetical protein